MIQNPDDIQITMKEIYPTIYDYELSEGYHFESNGFNWGKHIYGMNPLTNHYIVKKDETNTEKDSE